MGNQCEKVCLDGSDALMESHLSPNYEKLIKSELVQSNLPENLIPQTVGQKINLLNINFNLQNSQIWMYREPGSNPQQPQLVVYTIIDKQGLKKQQQLQNHKEQNIIINKTSGPNNQVIQQKPSLNPNRFQNATIFLCRTQQAGTQISISTQNSHLQKLILEKVYHGPIAPEMKAENAIIIMQNGEYYKGNVFDFKFQGKGMMKDALGTHQYEGDWKNNKPEGQGVQFFAARFRYEGSFKNGKWSGPGKLTLLNSPNKCCLEGNFVQGNLNGPGKIYTNNKQLIFEGLFKNGRQNGQGKWKSLNGQTYEGQFVDGKKQGYGKYTFRSGACYEGNFKDGQPQGEGVLTEGGTKTLGHWYKGENVLVYKNDNAVQNAISVQSDNQ